MNAKEIVDKFKEILLSKPEEVATEAIEVQRRSSFIRAGARGFS